MPQAEETRVLGEALHLLTSPVPNFQRLVEVVGEALDAEAIHLTLFEEHHFQMLGIREHAGDEVEAYSWFRASNAAGLSGEAGFSATPSLSVYPEKFSNGTDGNRLVVPILSSDDSFFGYFLLERLAGISFTPAERRIVDVLAGMMSSTLRYLSMQQALDENQQRWQQLVEQHPEPLFIYSDQAIQYANPAALRFLQIPGGDLASVDFGQLIPRHRTAGKQLHEAVEAARSLAPSEVLVQLPGGEMRTARVSVVPLARKPASVFLVIQDVSEEVRAHERRRIFVEAIAEGVACLSLATAMPVKLPLNTRLQRLLRESHLRESNMQFRRMLVRVGLRTEFKALSSSLRGLMRSLARDFVTNGHRLNSMPVTVKDDAGHTLHFILHAIGLVSGGALHEIWISVIDTTERVENERRTMTMLEEQQQSVGRDLHDGVGQLLTGIRLLGQNLVRRLEDETSPHLELARQLASYAQEATAHIRAIYHGLAPVGLEEEGARGALRALSSSVSTGMGIICSFESEGDCEIEDQMARLHTYRIAQEAVNNALKHAKARHIAITFTSTDDAFTLQVQDDGEGFDPGRSGGKSLGLSSMRYRSQALSGRLAIDSASGQGTVITCVFPRQ